MFKGIDISHHQGKVDWAALKNEVDFVIIRAGYGNTAAQKDTRFEEFYAGAKKYGIPVGCYWFSYATSAAEAKKEAQACLQCIKGKTFEYPVWYDVEHKHQSSVAICKAIIPTFIETIKEAGYYCGLYSYYHFLKSYVPESVYRNKYDLWFARYASNCNWDYKTIWQYSEKGRVNGIKGNVDMDYCYKDYSGIIANYSNPNYITEVEAHKADDNKVYPITSATNEYKQVHYSYDDKTQISKHFNVQEFKCKCGNKHDIVINTRLVAGLEKLFETFDCSKIIVNSGYRDPNYDKKLNGFAGKHSVGDAADVVLYDKNMEVISTKRVSCAAQDLPEYFGGIANINKIYTAIHLDVRQGNRWLGNEVISNSTVTKDFYSYYGLTKEDVYKTPVVVPAPEPEPVVVTPPMPEIKEEEIVVTPPPAPTTVTEESELKVGPAAGDTVTLKNTPLYSSALNASRYSSKKSGTYYVYDGAVVNGRIRITNKKENVGKKPVGTYVSGFVNVSDI